MNHQRHISIRALGEDAISALRQTIDSLISRTDKRFDQAAQLMQGMGMEARKQVASAVCSDWPALFMGRDLIAASLSECNLALGERQGGEQGLPKVRSLTANTVPVRAKDHDLGVFAMTKEAGAITLTATVSASTDFAGMRKFFEEAMGGQSGSIVLDGIAVEFGGDTLPWVESA